MTLNFCCGLDRLGQRRDGALAGRRVALVCNHTAVDSRGRHAVEVLRGLGAELVRLLGPEHGVWSTHQDMEPVPGSRDAWLGLPVESLYGEDQASLAPRPEALADIELIVCDIQDIGARYYTYAACIAYVLEAAAPCGIPVWVLDRPNPLGTAVEGPRLRPGFESYVGIEPGMPIRHGLSLAQLARWYRDRRARDCELVVVDAPRAYDRSTWVPPSPNMPSWETALVYPGMCLLEGTTLSEGRGTTTPFLLFGAPGVDPLALARELGGRGLAGVDFVPRVFRPEFGKHAGELCGGATVRVRDPAALSAVALGVHVLDAIRSVAPEAFGWRADAYEFVSDRPAIDLLWGSPELREVLEAGGDVRELLRSALAEGWQVEP